MVQVYGSRDEIVVRVPFWRLNTLAKIGGLSGLSFKRIASRYASLKAAEGLPRKFLSCNEATPKRAGTFAAWLPSFPAPSAICPRLSVTWLRSELLYALIIS